MKGRCMRTRNQLVGGLAAAFAAMVASAQPSYTVQEIGVLSGGNESRALAVNNFGFVAGWSKDGNGDMYPIVWSPLDQTTYSLITGEGFAAGINDDNKVAGITFATTGSYTTTLRVWNASTRALIQSTSAATSSPWDTHIITDIGEDGMASGYAYDAASPATRQAINWDTSISTSVSATLLDYPFPGADSSEAWCAKPDGELLGATVDGSVSSGYSWWNDQVFVASAQIIGSPSIEVVFDANERRVCTGYVVSSGNKRGYIWRRYASTVQLGALSGYSNSVGYGINTYEDVVGASYNTPESGDWWNVSRSARAFLYRDSTLYNLNDLIPSGTGWVLEEARDISDTGFIVGWGTLNGDRRGFILIPDNAQGCAGDENEDGVINFTDLNNVLSNWGERCN